MTTVTMDLLPAVHALDPIGLDELVERAALQTRVDRKYVLGIEAAEAVLHELAGRARALEIDGRRRFDYASLYYDTPDLTCYLAAAHRRRRRFKVRRREYLDSAAAYLEVKTRGRRGATVKERIPYAAPETRALTGEAQRFVREVLRDAGLDDDPVASLAPSLRTAYRRCTLHLSGSDSRVTLDTDLAWALPGGGMLRLDGLAIVETKADAAVCAADRVLWRHGHRPVRISKYGTGLAMLRPDLPSNRWHPVLRRHLLDH